MINLILNVDSIILLTACVSEWDCVCVWNLITSLAPKWQ